MKPKEEALHAVDCLIDRAKAMRSTAGPMTWVGHQMLLMLKDLDNVRQFVAGIEGLGRKGE